MQVGAAIDRAIAAFAASVAAAAQQADELPRAYALSFVDSGRFVEVRIVVHPPGRRPQIHVVASLQRVPDAFHGAVGDRKEMRPCRTHDVHRMVLEFLRSAWSCEAPSPADG